MSRTTNDGSDSQAQNGLNSLKIVTGGAAALGGASTVLFMGTGWSGPIAGISVGTLGLYHIVEELR